MIETSSITFDHSCQIRDVNVTYQQDFANTFFFENIRHILNDFSPAGKKNQMQRDMVTEARRWRG